MRWFARKPKGKAPVLKAAAEPVRMRRVRRDLLEVEPIAVDTHAADSSTDVPPASPRKTGASTSRN